MRFTHEITGHVMQNNRQSHKQSKTYQKHTRTKQKNKTHIQTRRTSNSLATKLIKHCQTWKQKKHTHPQPPYQAPLGLIGTFALGKFDKDWDNIKKKFVWLWTTFG